MTIGAPQPLGSACNSCPPRDELADAPSTDPSSEGVSQPPPILTDSHAVQSDSMMGQQYTGPSEAVGCTSPPPPAPLLPLVAQRGFISLRDA
ncbi:UNVERIFIED_CONTAM: hypothetical protein Sindi_0939600, partial [Sesamum indicum]